MYGDGTSEICFDSRRIPMGYASNDFLTWSPDGNKVAIAAECNVHIWLLGGGLSTLRDGKTCGIFREPDWSPDGRFIAYISEELGRLCPNCQAYYSDVFITSLDGSFHRAITEKFEGYSRSPAWSPDGRNLAFESDGELYVYSLDKDSVTNLSQHPANEAYPEWSLDGQWIAFLSDRSGEFELYIMRSDGSGQRRVADLSLGINYSISLTWLPDGDRILLVDQLIHIETGFITVLNLGFDATYATWLTQLPGASVAAISTPHCASAWSQLHLGIYAVVAGGPNDPPNRVRNAPDTGSDILDQIYPGDIVLVTGGPVCSEGLVFWQVESGSIPGGVGWTAEGDGTDYYLVPYRP